MKLNRIIEDDKFSISSCSVDGIVKSAIDLLKEKEYKRGLYEVACRLQMIACIVPSSTTKKRLFKMIQDEVKILEKKLE